MKRVLIGASLFLVFGSEGWAAPGTMTRDAAGCVTVQRFGPGELCQRIRHGTQVQVVASLNGENHFCIVHAQMAGLFCRWVHRSAISTNFGNGPDRPYVSPELSGAGRVKITDGRAHR